MKGSSARKAYVFAILAVLFWSTSPTAFKLGLRHLDTWQLLTGATLSSTLVLGIMTLLRGNLPSLRSFTRKDLLFSALMGLLNPVACPGGPTLKHGMAHRTGSALHTHAGSAHWLA